MHLLFLPGMHTTDGESGRSAGAESLESLAVAVTSPDASRSSLLSNLSYNLPPRHQPHAKARLNVWCLNLLPFSPLHFKLRVTSRLSFNDAGRITRHRDLWDAKDLVLALVPLLKPIFWIWARIVGWFVAGVAWIVITAVGKAAVHDVVAKAMATGPSNNANITTTTAPDDYDGDEGQADLNALGLAEQAYHHQSGAIATRSRSRIRPRRSNSTSVDVP